MYVIFPLDELLDLNSARGNKRGRATLDKQSHTRHTEVEVLPLSQPNQQLPNQLKPPLSQPPKSRKQSTASIKPLKTPTPPPPQKQQQQQQQQQQQSQPQKSTLTKTPSKLSLAVSPPSIVVPPQSPVSVPTSNQTSNGKKPPPTQQTVQPPPPPPSPQPPPPQPQPQPPEQVDKRQRSSHSTSTETSSTSSTGAKGKALLSPQASGGGGAAAAAAVTNRSSWGGSTAGPFQESCPARSGSFKAFKDLTVSGEGNSLKVVENQSATESAASQEFHGSTLSIKPPLNNSNSFRSHLSDSCAQRPRHLGGVEALKKSPGSASLASIPTQQQQVSVESARKPSPPQESLEQSLHSPAQPEPKGSEAVVTKQEIPLQAVKEKQTPGNEGVKIKQEVPVQAPPPLSPSQHQLTAAESLRIQQECLSPPTQRHPSGRSNRSSGSQKLSDLPPSGSGGGSRGASGSANLKNQGVLGGPSRGLQQQQRNPTAMATNESSFRDLTNPNVNESLKAHNAFTFKLVKTGPSSGALEESQSSDENLDDQS